MDLPDPDLVAAIADPRRRAIEAHAAVRCLQPVIELRDRLARIRNEAVAELFAIEERHNRPVQRNVAADLGITVQRLQEMLRQGEAAHSRRVDEPGSEPTP